jgi:hypothetical protein
MRKEFLFGTEARRDDLEKSGAERIVIRKRMEERRMVTFGSGRN